jgi:hypothetical protein
MSDTQINYEHCRHCGKPVSIKWELADTPGTALKTCDLPAVGLPARLRFPESVAAARPHSRGVGRPFNGAPAMIAAIDARKSTEQTGVADVQTSVARQVEHAREEPWIIAGDQQHAPMLVAFLCPHCATEIRLTDE